MKTRCFNARNKSFPDYGGRGISVCDRWRQSFEAFFEDVGPRPSPSHSLDRIDRDGHYEPGNVRWATPIQQANNKRNNRIVGGVTLAESSRATAINYASLKSRLKRGWTVERATTEPIRRDRRYCAEECSEQQ